MENNKMSTSLCVGTEEVYCRFYKCPNKNCKSKKDSESAPILQDSDYCPSCGLKLDWSDMTDEERYY